MPTLNLTDTGLLKTQCFINGQWLPADSGDTLTVTDPASGASVAEVADAGAAETERAVAAAQQALPQWRALTAKQRSQLLRNWYDLIIEHQDDLAQIMTAEQGKVLSESRGEVLYGASFVEWFAEEAKRIYGDVIPHTTANRRSLVIKQGVGVVAAVTPWNFPNAMITRKAAPSTGRRLHYGA